MFANAADAARRIQYRPVVALSAGYNSPAAAVIAHEAGCTEGFTFGQPFDRPDIDEDSGAAIGRTIALSMKGSPHLRVPRSFGFARNRVHRVKLRWRTGR